MRKKILRRLIKLGSSAAITIPPPIVDQIKSKFLWLEYENGKIILKPAEVK